LVGPSHLCHGGMPPVELEALLTLLDVAWRSHVADLADVLEVLQVTAADPRVASEW